MCRSTPARLFPAVLLAALAAALVTLHAQVPPVVPGASGYGMTTRAAYGAGTNPTVIRVTKIVDDGSTGTLRVAMEASGPRVVIFEISGTISLNGPIVVTNPYLTVAGQTAPSPGITVSRYGIQTPTHDVLLQHFRVRPGGDTCNTGLETWNGYNVVYDHMSVSWGQDENIVLTNGSVPMNTTVWRSIIAEGLHDAMNYACGGSPDGTFQAHGILIYDNAKNVSVIQNLLATNVERNPYAKGNTTSYIANNVIYNWGDVQAAIFADPDGAGTVLSTFVGNYLKRGPLTAIYSQPPFIARSRYLPSGSQLYMSDNFPNGSMSTHEVINGEGIDPLVGSPPMTQSGYSVLGGNATYTAVLPVVGARPVDRDAVDARIVAYVQSGGGPAAPFDSPSDVGGYPTLAVNTRALTTPANPHTTTGSGYTNLELWLHTYSAGVEASASTPTITTTTLPNPVLTVAYSRTVAASGGTAPYTWSLASGTLPTGLSLNTGTGAITGTASTASVYAFTLRVTDNVAATSTRDFSVTARAAITLTTTSPLPAAERQAGYALTLAATGDEAPYAWNISVGTLPSGLALNASSGAITGSPTALGATTFTARVVGALGSIATKSLSLTVSAEYRPVSRPVSRNAAEGVLFRRSTAPSNPYDRVMRGDLWSDTSTTPPTLKVCTAATESATTWAVVP